MMEDMKHMERFNYLLLATLFVVLICLASSKADDGLLFEPNKPINAAYLNQMNYRLSLVEKKMTYVVRILKLKEEK
jgi:hypothetical protein